MLNEPSVLVLKYILSNKDIASGYIVVESDDILLNLPATLSITKAEIESIIKELDYLKYINLAYNDGDNFCLTLTDKAKFYSRETTLEASPSFDYKRLVLACFLGGVSGSFLVLIVMLFVVL